jgi:hypothetical protein
VVEERLGAIPILTSKFGGIGYALREDAVVSVVFGEVPEDAVVSVVFDLTQCCRW